MSIGLASTQIVASNGFIPRRSKPFERPKIHCAACAHSNHAADYQWRDICEECGAAIRRVDAIAASRTGIQMDMWLSGIPVKFSRETQN